MEKQRLYGLLRENNVTWHQGKKTLRSGQPKSAYHSFHPDHNLKATHQKIQIENTTLDVNLSLIRRKREISKLNISLGKDRIHNIFFKL